MGGFAWVTLATNDSYSLGALVLAHSLRRAGTVHQLAVLVTPGVTPSMREKLGTVFDTVVEVNVLDSQDAANLALLARPDLGITFTKLHCWRLTQYDKCCFLDADTLVIQNVDELSEREELSAAPDVGWPDCFNSGVFVYKPSNDTFNSLMNFALQFGSFDGGDQGLLNLYFKEWAHKDISRHLPFIYNMSSTATYSYLPAFKQFGTQVKVIHFLGTSKPWLCYLDSESKVVQVPGEFNHVKGLLQFWWDIFCQNVHPSLTPSMHVDSSFFQAPHSHPAHQESNPALPTHSTPSILFIDPWDDYVERLRTETSQQNQKEGWLQIVSQDQRQRACDDQLYQNVPENDTRSQTGGTPQWPDTGHDDKGDPVSHVPHPQPSNPHSHDSNIPSDPSSLNNFSTRPPTPPLANIVSGNHSMDGHTEHNNSAGLAGALSQLTLGEPRSAEQTALEDHLRRQSWEQGHIDYMGRDSFENIWNKILKTLSGDPTPTSALAPETTASPVTSEPAQAAQVPAAAPQVPAAVSEVPAAVPEVPAAVPEVPAAVPEVPAAVPEVPAAVPEVPAAVPEVPAAAPQAPAAAPEAPAAAAPQVPPVAPQVPAAAAPQVPAPATQAPAVASQPPPAAAAPQVPPVAPQAPAAQVPLVAPQVPSADASAAPPTPTVTSATPPTSPPIAPSPQPQPSPEALKVDPTPPGTPPVAAVAPGPPSSEPLESAASAPVPPKRKGSGSSKGSASTSGSCSLG